MAGIRKCMIVAPSLILLLAAGCGGGGSAGSSGPSVPQVTAPSRTAGTLSLTSANSVEVGSQTVAVLTSLRTLAYQLARDLDSFSPASPIRQTPCSSGGSWTISYVDADNNGSRSVGDRIVMSAPGCSIAYFGNGRATATLLQVSAGDLVDVRIVIEGGTLPYLLGWNWVPAVTGTLRMTSDAQDLWLRSEGDLVLTPRAGQAFRAFNVGLRLRHDETNNPPAPGIQGGLNIGLDTPIGGGRIIEVETSGLFAGHAANVAPSPGPLLLKGAGRSAVRIVDDKPANPGWYLIATDANGDGVEESSSTVSFLRIFDTL